MRASEAYCSPSVRTSSQLPRVSVRLLCVSFTPYAYRTHTLCPPGIAPASNSSSIMEQYYSPCFTRAP
eukprot:6191053-Pleurochrysis_carterae.AAC.1